MLEVWGGGEALEGRGERGGGSGIWDGWGDEEGGEGGARGGISSRRQKQKRLVKQAVRDSVVEMKVFEGGNMADLQQCGGRWGNFDNGLRRIDGVGGEGGKSPPRS